MGITFSKSQIEAINHSGSNVAISASAGAGKTEVLVSRLFKRITQDKFSLKEIVAITFTVDAANKMKQKLFTRLNDVKTDENGIENNFVIEQLSNIDNSNISTIHSFCNYLIKRYHQDISLSFSQANNLIQPDYKKILLKKAAKTVFDRENPKELNEYITNNILSYDALLDNIENIIELALNQLNPKEWLKKDIDFDIIFNLYLEEIKFYFEGALIVLEKIKPLDTKNINEIINNILNLIDLLTKKDYQKFLLELPTKKLLFNKIKDLENDEDNLLQENCLKSLKYIYDKLASILMDYDEIVYSFNTNDDYSKKLCHYANEILIEYEKLKNIENCIDFNDLEHYAYKILTVNDCLVAKDLKNKYKEIMVDEFQDTSPLQYEIVKLISNDNLFLVGDVKQSIYAFRGADPSIFNAIIKDNNFRNINLKENYRSDKSVVEFNNEVFKAVMKNDYLLENITQNAGSSLDLKPKVRYVTSEDLVNGVVLEIQKLIQKGVSYQEIVVLVSKNDDKKDIKKQFEQAQIPYFLDDKSGYINSYAIDIVLNYLTLIYDNTCKEALFSTLISPLYQYDEDDFVGVDFDGAIKNNSEFKKDFDNIKTLCLKNRIIEAVEYILNINNFYDDYLEYDQKLNVDFLLEKITSYQDKAGIEIVDYLKMIKDTTTEFAYTSNKDDKVKVMTIHQSKGLDFNYVFLYSKSDVTTKNQEILLDSKLGIGIDYRLKDNEVFKKSINKIVIQHQNQKAKQKEFIRLFYVALTRAIKKIIVISPMIKNDYFNSLAYLDFRGYGFHYYIDYFYNNYPDYFDHKEIYYE